MKAHLEELVTEIATLMPAGMTHLVVEGDTDRRVFSNCLASGLALNVIPVDGHENVVDVITALNDLGFQDALGIIDRDYRHPLGDVPVGLPLEMTDEKDLECSMIDSGALDAVLEEFGSDQKILRLGGMTGVRQALYRAGREIGLLRFYYQKMGSGISFKALNIERLVDRNSLRVDPVKVLRNLGQAQTPVVNLPDTDIQASVAEATAATFAGAPYFVQDTLLCCGHDLVKVLSVALRSAIGTNNAASVEESMIAALLRIAFVAKFKMTALAQRMAGWLGPKLGVAPGVVWT